MKLLFVHADHLAFEARKPAIKSPPPLTPETARGEAKEALVVFFSVEEQDATGGDELARKAIAEVADVLSQVKAERVVLYPYAHLSNRLAKPPVAQDMGERLRNAASSLGVPVSSAPFGYYKAFTLQAKGHPLSELSRTVSLDSPAAPAPPAGAPKSVQKESEALTQEKKLVSSWHILTPDGTLHKASEFDTSQDPGFRAFFAYETEGKRAVGEEPPHVRLMRSMELVDYEPGSDAGNFRWYPKGQLVKRLLEEKVSSVVSQLGGMRVETPIMYDYEHPALKKYLNRFPARQYVLQSDDKDFFLRFAACFGQYLIFHDMVIGERDLPARLYELTHYSFRREQSGELSGLRRLRTFTMPDMHTLVSDVEGAKAEYLRQFEACKQWVDDLGMQFHVAIRFVRSFFDENREFATSLARIIGRPILLELWEDRFFYFVMKAEFHPLDTQGRAAALGTVQIDVENAERFEIHYSASDGTRKTPMLLHASISGAIERNVYALLEDQAGRMAKGAKAQWPFWLAPTQVRFLPVSDPHNAGAEKLMNELVARTGVRVDLDDRVEGIGRKIRDAEREWVPLVCVFGEKEEASGKLAVRSRDGPQVEMSLDELCAAVTRRQGHNPMLPLALSARLSQRPIFRG